MSCLMEFSMSPMDKGPSVGKYVARSIEIIDKSGLPYRLNPMGTVLEGEFDACISVIRACHERMSADCERITCSVKIDYRRGRTDGLTAKTQRIEETLKRSIPQ